LELFCNICSAGFLGEGLYVSCCVSFYERRRINPVEQPLVAPFLEKISVDRESPRRFAEILFVPEHGRTDVLLTMVLGPQRRYHPRHPLARQLPHTSASSPHPVCSLTPSILFLLFVPPSPPTPTSHSTATPTTTPGTPLRHSVPWCLPPPTFRDTLSSPPPDTLPSPPSRPAAHLVSGSGARCRSMAAPRAAASADTAGAKRRRRWRQDRTHGGDRVRRGAGGRGGPPSAAGAPTGGGAGAPARWEDGVVGAWWRR